MTLLDPTKEEEWEPVAGGDRDNCNLTVGFMPSLQQVCAYVHEGVSKADQLDEMLRLVTNYSLKVLPVAQQCLKESIEKSLANENDIKKTE